MGSARTAEIEHLRHTVADLERKLDAARRTSAALSRITEVDELAREALGIALEIAEAEAGSIWLHDAGKGRLICHCAIGDRADELTGAQIELDGGLAGLVFRTGKTGASESLSGEPFCLYEDLDSEARACAVNLIAAALKSVDGTPIGILQAANKHGAPLDHSDAALLEIVAAQMAAALESARLQEQARLATIMRFIGNISHDVKNMITPPMTGAVTLQMIADDCFRNFDQSMTYLALAEAEVESVAGTVAELRGIYPEMIGMIREGCEAVQQRMAEISAAVKGIVSQPNFEQTDIVPVVRRVGDLLAVHAQQKGVLLAVEPLGEIPAARIDPKQIYNAVYNLVYNAIDACECGDRITLRLMASPAGKFPEGNHILMECEDTGSGMPNEVKAKLFTDQSISTRPMGTGLGTRIVKNVIDAHGGRIEVASEVGVGTTIRCAIPIC